MTTQVGSLYGGSLYSDFFDRLCPANDGVWQDQAIPGQLYLQYGAPVTQSPSCYPSSYLPVSTFYYSPGSCPTGYTVACSTEKVGVYSDEVLAVCCPSGAAFSCAEKQTDSEAVYSARPWLTTLQCWSSITETRVMTVTEIGRRSNTLATRTFSDGVVGAYAINVMTVPDWTASNSPTSTIYYGDGGYGLPLGVAIGAGIGAALAVLLVAVAVWLILRRRRRRRRLRERPLELPKLTPTPDMSPPSTVIAAGVPDSAANAMPKPDAAGAAEEVHLVEGKFRVEDVAATRFKS